MKFVNAVYAYSITKNKEISVKKNFLIKIPHRIIFSDVSETP
ncbi:MAG: hypothetical protein RLZZ628_2184 [Bacteroidota bacterium]|jgi:hypothetical protein